jgi:hypothetical protein
MTATWILETIDESLHGQHFCTSCSSHIAPAEHDGAIWLECARLSEPRSGLRRLTGWTHTRTLLIAAADMRAA